MNRVKAIVKNVNVTSGKIFPIARSYSMWETDEVIGERKFDALILNVHQCLIFRWRTLPESRISYARRLCLYHALAF